MQEFVARANIDHFLDLLNNNDIPAENKTVIRKMLIEAQDKLARDLEQLEFAESRAATCRERVEHQRRLRDDLAHRLSDRVQADKCS